MQLLLKKNIFNVFWVTVLIGILSLIFNFSLLDIIFKALLMPLLMLALYLKTSDNRGRKKIMIALLFSFFGDVLLSFENKGPLFFITGLVCFLVTHIFYISYFSQIKQSGECPAKKYPYILVLIGLYTAGLLYLLWPKLGELKLPVIIYACVISIMLYMSLRIPYKIGRIAGKLFIMGALFFVISDTLLAINKFYAHFTGASLLIRLTYCLAQFFIVKGFIKKRY